MKVGIPRALLYYWYGPAWKTFLSEAGLVPVISPPTNKEIMTGGLKTAVDEICLPVKVFIGHCLELQKTCDAVLVPRLTSVARKEYTCPKFMGLPDMVRRLLPQTPVITWESTGSPFPKTGMIRIMQELFAVAGQTGIARARVKKALGAAKKTHAIYTGLLHRGYLPQDGHLPQEAAEILGGMQGETCGKPSGSPAGKPEGVFAGPDQIFNWDSPGVTGRVTARARAGFADSAEQKPAGRLIGLVGHAYCLYDSFVNTGILRFLQEAGCRVLTPEMLPEEKIAQALKGLPKALYWTMGRMTLGVSRLFRKAGVDGLIHVAAFACGPEALIGELVKRECNGGRIPYLQLYLDEHSGEAGLHTRLEAFLDLSRARTRGKEQVGCV